MLPSGVAITHIDAPHFLATKVAALASRGDGDTVASHDAEDIVLVLDGRPQLVDETRTAAGNLREFVAAGARSMLHGRLFMEALSGYFDPDVAVERAELVTERLRAGGGEVREPLVRGAGTESHPIHRPSPAERPALPKPAIAGRLAVMAVLTVLFGLYATPLVRWCRASTDFPG